MKNKKALLLIPVIIVAISLGVVFYPQEAQAHGAPAYSLDTMDVYQSSSTTLDSGTAICTGVSLTSASSCSTALVQGNTYRFEVSVSNSGDNHGNPNRFDMVSSVGTGDTLGATPGYTGSDGCDTSTDWTAATSGADVQSSAGNACQVSKTGGTVDYWIIVTIGNDAGTGSTTSTFFITDGTDTDTSTTTTFTIDAPPAPIYVVDLLSVYQSSSTTIGSGTSVCTSVDMETTPSSCSGDIERGLDYRFEVTVRNDGNLAGSPTQLDFQSAVGAGDTLGSILVGDILNSGCSTNTNWSESIASTTARASSGTTCSITSSGGTAVYWMIITIDSDAGTGSTTSTFDITDASVSDTGTTTTFTIIAATGSPTYVVDLLSVYESESTSLGTGNLICSAVDLETTPSTCNGTLEYGHAYRFQVTVRNDGTALGAPTSLEIDASVGDKDVFGTVLANAYGFSDSGCSTNADWTESISGGTDVRAASGSTCNISSSGGTAVYWMVIRVDIDAGGQSPTATFTIDDGAVSDVSTTTTFSNNNVFINGGGIY